jgi:DNA-binding transcriptional LysR family regulator
LAPTRRQRIDSFIRCHRLYPEVAIELRTGNPEVLAKAILADELDAALVAEPIADAPFEKMVAFVEQTVIVSAAGHAAIDRMKASVPCVLVFENGCPHRKRLEEWFAKRGVMPERTLELGSYHAMLGCVLAGMGIALLPESVLATFPKFKQLKIHRLPRGENSYQTVLIWRRGVTSPNIEALREILRDLLR